MSSGWTGHGWQPPPFPQGVDPRHVYVAPHAYPAWWNGENYTVRSTPANQPRFSKYPTLNPSLAEDTTLLRFDVKQKPSATLLASTYYANRHNVALATPTRHMRLVSKSFPWQIDIMTPTNVTCEDVWESLYTGLQLPIVDSEWGFIIKDAKQKEAMEAAMRKRIEADPNADKRPKRIDYLGNMTLFKGLEKDDNFVKLRVMPHSPGCTETWVIKLIS
ncbi:hypothetical protein BYT27DRAFT_7118072 [Phlegmacium glaucopus]|nr:hypothetical protein BYT27DRAFT_7118072 [Phlegmacium glaucopus]